MPRAGSTPARGAPDAHTARHLLKGHPMSNNIRKHLSPAQARDNVKDGPAQKRRRRTAWWGMDCFLCGHPMYRGLDRTGRGDDDVTIGHNLPHSKGGTYAWDNTHPACFTCNKATKTRDLTGTVPHGPAWPSDKDAVAFLAQHDGQHVRTGIGADERNASRFARFGF